MAIMIDDAEAAAERLEAALERIARAAVRPSMEAPTGMPAGMDAPVPEIAERLDRIIARLRVALDAPS